MIFQDPFASLNPRMRVRDIIGEAPLVHGFVSASDIDAYVDDIMLRVGLDPSWPPFEFVGERGQVAGLDVDLARAIGDRLGVEVAFVPSGWEGLYAALFAGPAAILHGYQQLLRLAGKDVDSARSDTYLENYA